MHQITLLIKALWDEEASYWVATSDDVPGLATGAATMEELIAKLKVMIPELIELNGLDGSPDTYEEIPFSIMAENAHQVGSSQAN